MTATNNKRTDAYVGLWIGGLITLLIGIMHFFMPTFGYSTAVPESMTSTTRDHFYYLGTYAIGAFLLTFGNLSLYIARNEQHDIALVFSILLTALWFTRTILEIIYPTHLKLFLLENPIVVLLPTTIMNTVLYGYAAYHLLLQNR